MRIRDNHMQIFIGRTDPEAEALMLWPSDAKIQLTGKDPDPEKDCKMKREWQRIRWLDGITDIMDMSLSKFREMVKNRAAVHGVAKSQTPLSNWRATCELKKKGLCPILRAHFCFCFWLGKKNNPILPSEFFAVELPPLFFSPFGVDAGCNEDTSFLMSRKSINMQLEWNRKGFA